MRRERWRWMASGVVLGVAATVALFSLGRGGAPAMAAQAEMPNDGKVRVLVLGAHPDDCELRAAGVAAKWAAAGHKVKFVSLTNGDIGHWREAGGPLAQRRLAEVKKCAQILGVETEVLDIHDGELLPTLENRRTLTRLIREWKADIVMAPRPNDYHPDHRYTGVLVQDAAFMVGVPKFLPETPALKSNPVFLYYSDRFQRPTPFRADIVVGIDAVLEKKAACIEKLESQFFEGGALGSAALIPADDAGRAKRRAEVRAAYLGRGRQVADQFRAKLTELYGAAAAKVGHAEAFEVCEYGRQPTPAEVRRLFPFFPAGVALP
jgi:LmbE family N-acetylglucosaminyl deacetylase